MKLKKLLLFVIVLSIANISYAKKNTRYNAGCTISVSISTTPYYCLADGGTATAYVYGGTAPYTYIWSDGLTTSSISGLPAGTGALTVKDATGCTTSENYTITSAGLTIIAEAAPSTIEYGQGTTLYVLFSDSTSSLSLDTISWSPSATVTNPNASTTTAYPKTTTTYTVTIHSPCGIFTDTVTVFIGCNLSGYIYPITSYYCPKEAGTVETYGYGGVAPYTYSWSNGATTTIDTGLSPGTYTVTIKDSNGCVFSDGVTISSDSLTVTAYASPNTTEPGEGTTLFVLTSDSTYYTDSVSWIPSASVTTPNSYITTAYPTTNTTYTVNVYTPCGILSDTVTVFIGCNLVTHVYNPIPYFCPAEAGAASAYAYGGVAPYTYSWSNGATTMADSALSPGTYTLVVKDAAGCSTTNTFTISSVPLVVTANAYPVSILAGGSTYLYANIPDTAYIGDTTYATFDTVLWTPSSSVSNPNLWGTNASPTVTTTYTVTVNGPCGSFSDTVTVFVKGCTNTFDQYICIVTTDTAINKNIIIWGRNNMPPDGIVNIYDSTASGWQLIGTVQDTSLSEYIDTASKPNTQAYSYSIATVDSCGQSALSPFNSTIYLQVIQNVTNDSLYWTPYVGIATPVYRIFRGLSLGSLTLIDSVSGTTFYYVDNSPPAGSIYLVEAVNPSSGCTPIHRRSLHSTEATTSVSMSNGGIPKKALGIAEINSGGNIISVSPNPGNGIFSVSYSLAKEQTVGVELIDEFGRTVYEKQLSKQPAGVSKQLVDFGNISEGIYTLRIVTTEGTSVRKLVIVR